MSTTMVPAKCKFCGVPVHLEIDDEYDFMDDRYKIMRLACCNECARLKTRSRQLGEALSSLSTAIDMTRDKKELEALRDTGRTLLIGFMRMVSDNLKLPKPLEWDEEILDGFMDNPKKIGTITGKIWFLGKQAKAQKELL